MGDVRRLGAFLANGATGKGIPPDTSKRYLGFDAAGDEYTLRFGIAPARDAWSALGWPKGFPSCRVLVDEDADLIVRWVEL